MKNEPYTINATDIEIWARIGVHKEESLVENCFRISVHVNAGKAYHVHHYINYEIIVDKVKLVFGRPQRVLEDICIEIINEIKMAIDAPVASIECEIKKIAPAIEGMKVGALGVRIIREY